MAEALAPLDAVDRLAAAGVPCALAGRWAAAALAGGLPPEDAPAVVAVAAGRERDAAAIVGRAAEVTGRTLADGDVVEATVGAGRVPCLRAEIVLLGLVGPSPSPSPSPSAGDVEAARALAAATGVSLPPLPPTATVVERGDAVIGPPAVAPAPLPPGDGPGRPDVRDAVAADAAAIAAVHVATWQAAYAGHMPAPFLAGLDVVARWRQWSSYLGRAVRPGHLLVAGPPGTVEGFVLTGPAGAGLEGEVLAIYCHPSVWGTGRGRALLAAAEERLVGDGFDEAVLWVLAGNERACRFYEAAGWAHDGTERVDEVGPPGPDRIAVHEARYRTRLRR